MKAGEGPARFALASQEPTAIPGKTTKGTQSRNVHHSEKVGWQQGLANKPQQGLVW